MPELPEVEHLRRTLLERLPGRRVVRATLHRRDVAVGPGDPPGGFSRQRAAVRPTRLSRDQMLEGAILERIDRRGKLMAVVARNGRALGIHLGMSGQVLWARGGGRLPAGHVHATWRLDDGSRFVFRDPRRFGGLWVAATRDELAPWAALGPDALTLEPDRLVELLASSKRPVKAALLDQRLLAGVGNIYADEALHRAGVHPFAIASELTDVRAQRLGRAIRDVLAEAIKAGGSTLRDHRGADGRAGSYQARHRVYGRGGRPCLACDQALQSGLVGQRTTVWCRECQSMRMGSSTRTVST